MSALSISLPDRPGLPAPDFIATQRQPGGLSPAGRPARAERVALDPHAGAATQPKIVAIATHLNRPDLSHFLDTGHCFMLGVVAVRMWFGLDPVRPNFGAKAMVSASTAWSILGSGSRP